MLMIERTLLLVKPDGASRALIGKIISQMEESGLKVVAMKMVLPDEKIAGEHYIYDKDWLETVGNKSIKSFAEKGIKIKETALQVGERVRGYLIKFLVSGPVVPMVIEGNEAISIVRKLIGTTEPKKADPSTVRGRFSTDSYGQSDARQRPILNLVHASEDEKTAAREIAVWFKKSEIVSYKRADEGAMY